ncbi:MAG: hypothetical protein IKM39_00115 [Clostridia bacterium]|nr:hypothetical protein [Clostridia bacterium]
MFRLFFGSPGCGKTTLAVALIYKDRKRRKPYYDYHFTNFDCSIARNFNAVGLGSWTFPKYSYVAFDESGVVFNGRQFKKMSADFMEWAKEHRHYSVDADFFSQTWSDTDKVIRDLATEIWHLKKIGPWTLCRRIKKKVDIDEQTHQPMDMFFKSKMLKRFLPFPFNERSFFVIFRPKYYKYFDTHERKNLPVRYFGSTDPDTRLHNQNPLTALKGQINRFKRLFDKSAPPPEPAGVEELSTATKGNEEIDLSDIGL